MFDVIRKAEDKRFADLHLWIESGRLGTRRELSMAVVLERNALCHRIASSI